MKSGKIFRKDRIMNKKNKTTIIVSIAVFAFVIAANFWMQKNKERNRELQLESKIKQAVDEKLKTLPAIKKMKKKVSDSQMEEKQSQVDLEIKNSIDRLFELDRKVIHGPDERKELESLLSNQELIQDSFEMLNDIQATHDDGLEKNQSERMRRVLFLTKALEWEGNPSNKELVSQVQEFVIQDNLPSISDIKARKSFAADKVELFANLKYLDIEKGLEIEDRNISETNAKLMRFANNFYKLNKERRK